MTVRLQDVSKAYPESVILDSASLELGEDDRVGLVGINGAGKTTVLRLMLGDVAPDDGLVERTRGARVGYLPQEVDIDSSRTVLEEVLSALPQMHDMEARLASLEEQLGSEEGDQLEQRLEEYGRLREQFERAGGYTFRARAESVLQGLGLTRPDWSRQARHLSGGQKSRLMLARLLLAEPDALLLDEPTNHLDIQAIEWLERFLASYKKAFLIVSHDRYFLDRTVQRIVLLERARLRAYPGNYTKFRKLHEEEVTRQRKEFERQEELVTRTKDFIRRNIAGQKTKQAKSRIKMLDKLEPVERPREVSTRAAFRFKQEERSGEKVLWAEEITVGYGADNPVLRNLSLALRRRDRVGLVGPNGSGKTTLLKTLAGRLPALSGRIGIGARVTSGYFDQEQSDLDDDKTVLDTIWELMRMAPEVEVRSFLGLFDFSEERVHVSVGDLSGGERGRLQLACIVKQSPNLLLLDEPTNHLDLHTREALEEALSDFTGTMIVVSHDRYFLDRVCNTILAIEGDDEGRLETYLGNFTEYHHALERRGQAEPEPQLEPDVERPSTPPTQPRKQKRGKKKQKPRPEKKPAPRRRSVSEIETEIFELESELRVVSDDLSQVGSRAQPRDIASLKQRYEKIQAQLQDLYQEWEQAAG